MQLMSQATVKANRKLIPMFQEIDPTNVKERLLWPFAKRYRNRLELTKFSAPLRLIANEVLVFPKQKFLLVKNSKAGCTSAANILYQCFRGEKFEGDIHRTDIGLTQGRNHLIAVHEALLDPQVVKITTVRHPVTRAISGFYDFFVDQRNPGSAAQSDAISHFGFSASQSEAENFHACLDMLEHSFSADPHRVNRHFRLQTVNTAIEAIEYTKLCRVESLYPDIIGSLKNAGVPSAAIANISREVRNASRAAGFVPDADHLRKIENLYRDDFSAFDYDLNNF